MWCTETLYPDVKISLKGKLLYKEKTPYQDLKIYKTERFGNLLLLDGAIQTTEKDEFIYHEMLTHTVMLIHPQPKRILIIGGGDGGILKEVIKYKDVESIYLVEIDKRVIEISQKYLKTICQNAFEDKRVNIIIEDGAKFVKKTEEKFDIVIIDSPDPVGVAKVLFSSKFYKNIFNCLEKDGLMIRQTGSTILQKSELEENWKILNKIFPYVWIHLIATPTYIGGFFSLTVASKKIDLFKIDIDKLEKKFNRLKIKTKYYNPYLHIASSVLPEYIRRKL